MAEYGLDTSEIDRWHNTVVFSPTQQVLLLSAAQALQGVAGRAELFRHATNLTSEVEAGVYLRSVGLLVVAHRQQSVESLLPGVRLPAARLADGRVASGSSSLHHGLGYWARFATTLGERKDIYDSSQG